MSVRRLLAALAALAAAALLVSCSTDAPAPPGPDGRLTAAITMPALAHDVAFFQVSVVPAGAPCDAEPVLPPAVVPLEDEYLPLWLEPDPPAGAYHPFGDALFVLQPGLYDVCAVPLTADLLPSAECASVSTDEPVEVLPEQTTEIVLFALCEGDPTGALDVVVALNDPPHIDDLVIEPSKFVTICEPGTVTVFASDPNGDALTYTWELVSGPLGGPFPLPFDGPTVTAVGPEPGLYIFRVTISDGHGGVASLEFPVHVSFAECCGDGQCFQETCATCPEDCGPCPLTDCCAESDFPGCEDPACADAVCAIDPFCCEVRWDGLCVSEAEDLCPQCAPVPCPPDALGGGACAPAGDTCDLPEVCCPAPFEFICAAGFCECTPEETWICAIPDLFCPEPCPAEPPAPGEPCNPPQDCPYGEQVCPDGGVIPEQVCFCSPDGWECFPLECPPVFEPCPPFPPPDGAPCPVEQQGCFYDAAGGLCCEPGTGCSEPSTVSFCGGGVWQSAPAPFCPSPFLP